MYMCIICFTHLFKHDWVACMVSSNVYVEKCTLSWSRFFLPWQVSTASNLLMTTFGRGRSLIGRIGMPWIMDSIHDSANRCGSLESHQRTSLFIFSTTPIPFAMSAISTSDIRSRACGSTRPTSATLKSWLRYARRAWSPSSYRMHNSHFADSPLTAGMRIWFLWKSHYSNSQASLPALSIHLWEWKVAMLQCTSSNPWVNRWLGGWNWCTTTEQCSLQTSQWGDGRLAPWDICSQCQRVGCRPMQLLLKAFCSTPYICMYRRLRDCVYKRLRSTWSSQWKQFI